MKTKRKFITLWRLVGSPRDVLHDLAVHVGQAVVPSLESVGQSKALSVD
ncbi:MAG: hypothetical protein QGG01_04615 [Roseibacillus sp.]|nr:hypothetical protein [Roseibacillus sp.]MDP7496157.1 hypothetical protein [Roseibacillus sp.]